MQLRQPIAGHYLLEPIISNVVLEGTDDDKTLSVSYTELIPVLINAIKEQQEIINNLESIVGSQKSKLNNQNRDYLSLLARIEALEKERIQDHALSYD